MSLSLHGASDAGAAVGASDAGAAVGAGGVDASAPVGGDHENREPASAATASTTMTMRARIFRFTGTSASGICPIQSTHFSQSVMASTNVNGRNRDWRRWLYEV